MLRCRCCLLQASVNIISNYTKQVLAVKNEPLNLHVLNIIDSTNTYIKNTSAILRFWYCVYRRGTNRRSRSAWTAMGITVWQQYLFIDVLVFCWWLSNPIRFVVSRRIGCAYDISTMWGRYRQAKMAK